MKNVFAELSSLLKSNKRSVLCAIVKSSGSAPRRSGSLMLADGNGTVAGSVGGGAVEYDAAQTAREMIASGKSTDLKAYSLNSTGEIGMVCGGDVSILFVLMRPEDPQAAKLTEDVLAALSEKRPGTLSFYKECLPVLNAPCVAPSPLLTMPLPVGDRAILFGAGHISAALCPLLAGVGFRVTVMDCRAEYASVNRFPSAERVIAAPYEDISAVLDITPDDYIVIMTNGHIFDLTVEEQILRKQTAYVGVIGSRSKTAAVNQKLREAGIGEDMLSTVHTPVGTPINAVTPEEIAISIAGEMILERALIREQTGSAISHGCPMHRD